MTSETEITEMLGKKLA